MSVLELGQGAGGVQRIAVDVRLGTSTSQGRKPEVYIAIEGWDPCDFSLSATQAFALARILNRAGIEADSGKPYAPPVLTRLEPSDPRVRAMLDGMNAPTPKAGLLELVTALRAIGDKPAAKAALRGLEAALPEASALVRGALADPAGTLGDMVAPLAEAAADELADADRTIAAGLARALGRGFARGSKRQR